MDSWHCRFGLHYAYLSLKINKSFWMKSLWRISRKTRTFSILWDYEGYKGALPFDLSMKRIMMINIRLLKI